MNSTLAPASAPTALSEIERQLRERLGRSLGVSEFVLRTNSGFYGRAVYEVIEAVGAEPHIVFEMFAALNEREYKAGAGTRRWAAAQPRTVEQDGEFVLVGGEQAAQTAPLLASVRQRFRR